MNPIEKLFSVIKSHLRRSGELQTSATPRAALVALFRRVATPELMRALYRSSGFEV
jgi:hypothetical protein